MMRRMLAAAGVAVVVSAVAAAPAAAGPGEQGTAARDGRDAGPGLVPWAGEWWFTSWKILPRVWPLTRGAGVTVAVIDTGVQASVPDLRGAVLPGGDFTGHRTNGQTDFNTDGDGHGTMVAVLIAGQGFGTGMAGVDGHARTPAAVSIERVLDGAHLKRAVGHHDTLRGCRGILRLQVCQGLHDSGLDFLNCLCLHGCVAYADPVPAHPAIAIGSSTTTAGCDVVRRGCVI